ncbi:MAG TPA: BON domain-containing protein [Gemmataceae bacterium]|nr:BON domain-containing protein [Gemmataceae bacterium]
MPKSGVRRILPTAEPTGEKDALQATVPLLVQSLLDQDLAERVERALRATGYGPLRFVEVSVQAQLVILAGRVPSYYLKQIAQTAVQAVPGTHQVRNDLEVV